MVRTPLTTQTGEKKVILALATFLFVLAFSYIYFVNQTVVNVVERRALEQELDTMHGHVSQLTFTYMELKSVITREEALTRGFHEPETLFVARDTALSLSLHNN